MKREFEPHKTRQDMMELWKETFHDSNRYIELVFDAYFQIDNIFVRYDGDTLIASMLCVPYEFSTVSEGVRKKLKGMYLCGLATRPEYRKRGIMSGLIKEAEANIKKRGYDLTFLIPADRHLRDYYGKMGYYDGSYKTEIKLKPTKIRYHQNMYIYTFKELRKLKGSDLLLDIVGWCREIESNENGVSILLHSEKDLLAVISENENSIFLSNRPINSEYSILANLRSVVFPELSMDEEGNRHVKIVGYYINSVKRDELIDRDGILPDDVETALIRYYSDHDVIIEAPWRCRRDPENRVHPYAMIKSLGNESIFSKYNKSTFRISLMLD
ncbi:MAG: GNAT family N-acetyltransferase [Muribaculaceae bacterium]|nr:GNAT family N-acetyltransferase [Muribaculaceae bacterium]